MLLLSSLGLVACGDEANSSGDPNDVTFSALRVEQLGARRAVIAFETSRATTCEVEYGVASDSLDSRATDPTMNPDEPFAIDHRVPLEDLQAETTYYIRAVVVDPDGNTYRSGVDSFTTLADDQGLLDFSNVALLETGSAISDVSSNFGNGPVDGSWGGNNTIDGSMATEWATNGDGNDAFIEIDLGASHELVGIGFRSREMANGSSIITSFELTFDGEQTLGPFDSPDPSTLYQYELDSPISARVVRVDAITTSGGNTGAKAIELYIAQ